MSDLRLLVARCEDDPYNEVTAHALPDGGVAVMLSHRISMDRAAVVRVRADEDVLFADDPADVEALERTNRQGPWGRDPDERTMLVHVNVAVPGSDKRDAAAIAETIMGALEVGLDPLDPRNGRLRVAVPLAEEVD